MAEFGSKSQSRHDCVACLTIVSFTLEQRDFRLSDRMKLISSSDNLCDFVVAAHSVPQCRTFIVAGGMAQYT